MLASSYNADGLHPLRHPQRLDLICPQVATPRPFQMPQLKVPIHDRTFGLAHRKKWAQEMAVAKDLSPPSHLDILISL